MKGLGSEWQEAGGFPAISGNSLADFESAKLLPQMDRGGSPFIDPAGQLLDRALAEASIDRDEYLRLPV